MGNEGDLISGAFARLVYGVDGLSAGTFLLFPRVSLMLFAGWLAQEIAFRHGSRSALGQIGAFLLGAFLSLYVPLEYIWRLAPGLKLCLLLMSLLGLVLLPLLVAPMTFPQPVKQRLVLKVLYGSVALVVFLNLVVQR